MASRAGRTGRWRNRAILLLFVLINTLCYLDRGAMSASLISFSKSDLGLTELQNGSLSTIFIVGFMVAAPVFGKAATVFSPMLTMLIGMLFWSAATICTGLSNSYSVLMIARLVTGVGEASFVCIAAPIIDLIAPKNRRSTWLSCFYVAIPFGFALGIAMQGLVIQYGFLNLENNWRIIFVFEGLAALPFLALSLLTPSRAVRLEAENRHNFNIVSDVFAIMSNPVFTWTAFGYAMQTFVVGGYSSFGDAFLEEADAITGSKASLLFGTITFVAGVAGTASGGFLLDQYSKSLISNSESSPEIVCAENTTALLSEGAIPPRRSQILDAARTVAALRIVSTAAWMILPCFALSFLSLNLYSFLVGAFLTEFFVFACLSPCNSAIMWSQKDIRLRPLAMAISSMMIHIFGDAISPTVIGVLIDYTHNWLFSLRMLGFWLVAALAVWIRATRLGELELQSLMFETIAI